MKKYIGILIVLGVLVFGASNVFAGTSVTRNTADASACLRTTAPWIKVTSPNGGEIYTIGQQITVTWTSCNVSANTMLDITLKNIDQPMEQDLTSIGTLNDGSETFTLNLPLVMQLGNHFKVLVNDSYLPPSSGPVADWSDNLFTINSAKTTTSTTSITTTTTTDTKSVQAVLISQGYLNGKADGKIGPVTVKAIKDFQKANSLPVTGNIDSTTISNITPKVVTTPNSTAFDTSTVTNQKATIHVFYASDGLMLPSATFSFNSGSGLSVDPILNPVLGLSIGQHGLSASQQGEVSSITFKLLSASTPIVSSTNYYLINSVGAQVSQPQTISSNNTITFNDIGDTHSGSYDRRLFLTSDHSFVGAKAKFVVTKLEANTYAGTQSNMIYSPIPCSKIILPEGNNAC